MSGPTTSDPAAVAVALAELRGTMETGFANLDVKLALLAQRGDQNDRRLEAVEHRLDIIERGESEQQKRTHSRLDAAGGGPVAAPYHRRPVRGGRAGAAVFAL